MNSGKTRPNDRDDQLDPSLRKVVQRIADRQPPEELVTRCVTLAKSQTPQLRPEPARHSSRRAAPWLIAVAIAASIMAMVVLRRPADDSIHVAESNPPVMQEENSFDSEWVSESPTLWAYRRRAHQTPDALDDLLDTHAREFRVSGPAMPAFGS
jgi:hypothetical protein